MVSRLDWPRDERIRIELEERDGHTAVLHGFHVGRVQIVLRTSGVWRQHFDHNRRVTGRDAERVPGRSEEHTSELQSHHDLVCRLLLEKKKKKKTKPQHPQ